jgi:hypothetical protein
MDDPQLTTQSQANHGIGNDLARIADIAAKSNKCFCHSESQLNI